MVLMLLFVWRGFGVSYFCFGFVFIIFILAKNASVDFNLVWHLMQKT